MFIRSFLPFLQWYSASVFVLGLTVFCIGKAAVCQGNTLTVDPNGGGQFFTIQDAIDNSQSGDTIMIAPEEYQELITITNKDLTLCSTVPGEKVKLDANQMGSAALISSDDPMDPATVELIDFEIKNGSSGGVEIFDVNLFLMDCIICQCSSPFEGGGIFQVGGSLTGVDTSINNNMAGSDGGGVFTFDGFQSYFVSDISDNTSGRDGGGIAQVGGSDPDSLLISLTESELNGNTAVGNGGGLFVIDVDEASANGTNMNNNVSGGVGGGGVFASVNRQVETALANLTIEGNESVGAGGGIFLQDVDADLADLTFDLNETETASGGGLYTIGGTIKAEDVVIQNNNAGMNGGGIQLVDQDPNVAQKFINVLIKNNIAQQNGGGVSITDPDSLVALIKSKVIDNQAAMNGGGIFVSEATCDLVNSHLMSNDAGAAGGGFYNNQGEVDAVNTIVDGSTASTPGGGFFNNQGTCTLTNCNLVGNLAPIGGAGANSSGATTGILNTISVENGTLQLIEADTGSIDAHNSIVEGGFSGTDILDVPANFADSLGPDGLPGTGDEDYSLNPDSLGIDSGNNFFVPMDQHDVDWDGDFDEQIPQDYDCLPRFQNGLDAGEAVLGVAIVDIGAIEFQEPVFVLGDVNGDGNVNLLDIQPFVDLLSNGNFQAEADTNQDGLVNLLDIEPFIDLLSGS